MTGSEEDIQYMMASNTSQTSARSSTGRPITSSSNSSLPSWLSEVESLGGVTGVGLIWCRLVLLQSVLRGALFLRVRDMT